MVTFTLCADDFGLHQGIDDGVLELVRAGRLNAVSCMSVGDTLGRNAGALLQAAEGRAQIGLHLTFTEYAPIGPMPLLAPDGVLPSIGALIKHAYLRRLDRDEVAQQVARQVQVFRDTFGRAPDFVDGHQHAHILPGIRDAVISAVQDLPAGVWVRSCDLPFARIARMGVSVRRAVVISALARRMKGLLRRNAIPTNGVFYGINDFQTDQDFGAMMRVWLNAASNARQLALIMCHPGRPKTGQIWDPIADRRPDELSYLASARFAQDMAARDLTLAPPPVQNA